MAKNLLSGCFAIGENQDVRIKTEALQLS